MFQGYGPSSLMVSGFSSICCIINKPFLVEIHIFFVLLGGIKDFLVTHFILVPIYTSSNCFELFGDIAQPLQLQTQVEYPAGPVIAPNYTKLGVCM